MVLVKIQIQKEREVNRTRLTKDRYHIMKQIIHWLKSNKVLIIAVILISVSIWALLEYNKTTVKYLYGNSYRQNRIVNTIRLHQYGITGKGIKVGIVDAGFYTAHTAFKKTRIIEEFDFAVNLPSVSNQDHISGMDHGTNVFSMIGGYQENEILGIAYGADFYLAKSDKTSDRLTEEEGYAVNAYKWLSGKKVNIITTSLSYNKFEKADYYTPEQMDGNTALITRVADSLSAGGIVFVSSAGNQFEEEWQIVEPPADGFMVLAAGSIDKDLNHSFFSSSGPTIDGRIKPDIVTPGEGVWTANYLPGLKEEFGWNHGTSLAAPVAAGIAALVLSAHPDLSADQVREAIRNTSSRAGNPDNLYGWGIPDAEMAVSYFGPAFSNLPGIIDHGGKIEITTYVLSGYGLDRSSIEIHLLNNGKESVNKMNEEDDNFFSYIFYVSNEEDKVEFYFTAKDSRGNRTKFPSSFLGDHFTCIKKNGRFELTY